MFTRGVRWLVFPVALAVTLPVALAQQVQPSAPATSPPPDAAQVFPVTMQQNVVAGKTPPGTQVQANLEVATLVNGKVIPRNAVLAGEVVESKARTSSDPARLSIRLDSARWKDGSAPIKVYLTPWFYPVTFETAPNLQYGPEQSAKKAWNGMGPYPEPNSPTYSPFPSAGDGSKAPSVNPQASVTSKHPTAMKDVDPQSSAEGITLVSKRTNLKLDKITTYIFASSVPSPNPETK